MFGTIARAAKRVPIGITATENGVNTTQKRFASDKQLRTRMVAVTNIKKITKAMKMVASAKVRRAEQSLNNARAFESDLAAMWPTEVVTAEQIKAGAGEVAPAPNATGKFLLVAITPDRGLCGSVNGQVVRGTRNRAAQWTKAGRDLSMIGLGEKARAGLERNFSKDLALTIGEHAKLKQRTFKQTAQLAAAILATPFEEGEFIYNHFKNLMSFDTNMVRFQNLTNALADPKQFEVYNQEGDAELLENFYEFSLAVRLHRFLAETDMVEFSQRVNSMTNSSKNAEAMLGRLRLLYNRSRQAKITTELVEIISGATAAAEQVA